MALNPNQIIIAGTGHLYAGPEGTALPANLNDDLATAFAELGYTTEDGAQLSDEKTVNRVRPWQSFYPVRVHVTERMASLEFTLMQWNPATMALAFGGGTFEDLGVDGVAYHPPSPEELGVNAFVLDFVDGDKNYRLTIARGFVTSNTESQFAKAGPALLPITFEVLANAEDDPWTFYSDDPAWLELVS